MFRHYNPIPADRGCDVEYPAQALPLFRIGPEGQDLVVPEPPPTPAMRSVIDIDGADLLERLAASAAIIPRRTCPDLLRQLRQALSRPVDTVICNLADDDGPPPVQAVLAAAFAPSILIAMASLGAVTGARRALICMPAGAPAWLREPLAAGEALGIRMQAMQPCYPQSHPSLLLPALLGRRMALEGLPTDRGVLLLDALAAAEIGSILQRQRGIGGLPLAVGDHVRGRVHCLLVPAGMSVGRALAAVDINPDRSMLVAGELPSQRQVGPETPAQECGLKLHVLPRRAADSPGPCTRCGECLCHCPTGAHPAALLEAAQQGDPEIALRAGLELCILCGVCSLVCPSQLPLVTSIRTLLP
jgi:Na+-translocating ferredoxin:NAD+ oxidoreductase subunit C